MGRLELQFFNVGKKLKLLIGVPKEFTLLEIWKKAIRYFLYIQKQKFLISLAVENGFPSSTTMAAMTLTVLQLSLENPFVAPTLTIKPTQVNHHGDLGFNATQDRDCLSGSMSTSVSTTTSHCLNVCL